MNVSKGMNNVYTITDTEPILTSKRWWSCSGGGPRCCCVSVVDNIGLRKLGLRHHSEN